MAKKVQDYITEQVKLPLAQQLYFNLTAILLGDPLVNPIPQRLSRYKIAEGLGIMDKQHMIVQSALNRLCLDVASQNWTTGDDVCGETIDYAVDVSGSTFSYDASMFSQDWDNTAHEDDVKNYIQSSNKRQELYQAIHIDKSTKVPLFNWGSRAVADGYEVEDMVDWSEWVD